MPVGEKTTYRKRWWKRGFTCNTQSDPVGKKWATHLHDVDEIVALLDGKITVEIGTARRQAKRGQEIVIRKQVPHSISNPGHISAHYLYGFRKKR